MIGCYMRSVVYIYIYYSQNDWLLYEKCSIYIYTTHRMIGCYMRSVVYIYILLTE